MLKENSKSWGTYWIIKNAIESLKHNHAKYKLAIISRIIKFKQLESKNNYT